MTANNARPPIAIVAAMKVEFADLLSSTKVQARHVRQGHNIVEARHGDKTLVFVETGVGRQGAEAAAGYVVDNYDLQCVVSIGFAGGLVPGLRVGDIVVYSSTYRDYAEADAGLPQFHDSHAGLVELAVQSANGRCTVCQGGGITVPNVVATSRDKAGLAAAFPVQAVDMESYWVARAAARRGLPFVTVRAVSDAAGDELPDLRKLRKLGWRNGKWRWHVGLPYLVSHPVETARLVSLWRKVRRARRNLTRYMQGFLARL